MRICAQLASTGLVIGLALAGVSLAGDAPSFEELDVNDDGTLSTSEAAKASDLDFAAADLNKDGKLSRAEYDAAVS
jgi:hypothetical protein